MNITIIGAGNMGSAFVKQFTRAGHKVRVTARTVEKAQAVAAANPGAIAARPSDALGDSSVVIVATGYADAVPALKSLGSLAGKVVIDVTNPVSPDYMSLTIGHATSAAEYRRKYASLNRAQICAARSRETCSRSSSSSACARVSATSSSCSSGVSRPRRSTRPRRT